MAGEGRSVNEAMFGTFCADDWLCFVVNQLRLEVFHVELDSFQPRLERIQCVEPNTQTIMDFDFSALESSFLGGSPPCDIPLVFDLVESGFPLYDEFTAAQPDAAEAESPKRDPPQQPSASSEDEESCESNEDEEIVEQGGVQSFHDSSEESGSDSESYAAVNPLAQPTHSGAALNTPRTQRDRLDYDEDGSSHAWLCCDAWVGAVCMNSDGDTRLRVPGVDGVPGFAHIPASLENQQLPAAELLCRILLARILFAWEISVRIAFLRSTGYVFPELPYSRPLEYDPTLEWVWSVFGPLDSCDRVDVPAIVKCNGKTTAKVTVATPVWIWWYISLVFTIEGDRLVPRPWTGIQKIAEYANAIDVEESEFPYIIQANGVAALYKRHIQLLRGARFFSRTHPFFETHGIENIECMTAATLGSVLTTNKNRDNRVVQRLEAKLNRASRMRRQVGMFKN